MNDKQVEEALHILRQSHKTARDECSALRHRNALLERNLLERGIDVDADLEARIKSSGDPPHFFGLDHGYPDFDLVKNNDSAAINTKFDIREAPVHTLYVEMPFDPNKGIGYYSQPVPVTLPESMNPKPTILHNKPMNMLYFHHFVNHTARTLVAHDCADNPFREILPRMALEDVNLLPLLLTYSATHRARLLGHSEPSLRIASWMQDVFSAYRRALSDPSTQISNSLLATAIMLTSLAITGSSTIGISIPWQNHRDIARNMISARGRTRRTDLASYFLVRWFARLDVFGCLSAPRAREPLTLGDYWPVGNSDDEFKVDCILGCSQYYMTLLARISCSTNESNQQRPDSNLFSDLQHARMHRFSGCSRVNEDGLALIEMDATNTAFYLAGSILYDHYTHKSGDHTMGTLTVQGTVCEIVSVLYKIRPGGTAEACLLYPMFVAGCTTRSQRVRGTLLMRLNSMEVSGGSYIRKARTFLEKIWEEMDLNAFSSGLDVWEKLNEGKFLGRP